MRAPPRFISPQLATLVDQAPRGVPYVYEIKFDGYRALATLDRGKVRIATRSGLDWTDSFGTLARAVAGLDADNAVLDGEICYLLDDGRSDFQHLQNAMKDRSPAAQSRLAYYVFDLLFLDGEDFRPRPLAERKRRLAELIAAAPAVSKAVRFSEDLSGDPRVLLAQSCQLGLEGLIGKRPERPYVNGRNTDWIKLKCQRRQEFVIVGFTAPQGSRSGFGSLLLAVRDGDALRYTGRVGTGFSESSLRQLTRRLGAMRTAAPPVTNPPRRKDITWTEPRLVCEVSFTEMTRDGSLRHPSFEGLREDKPPEQVTEEKPAGAASAATKNKPVGAASAATKNKPEKNKPEKNKLVGAASAATKTKPDKNKLEKNKPVEAASAATKTKPDKNKLEKNKPVGAASAATRRKVAPITVAGVRISNPDRVMDRSSGTTKLDLARYHEKVIELVMPYAGQRPLALVRCPAGDAEACFFQKRTSRGMSRAIRHRTIAGNEVIYVTEPRGWFELVQFNGVEFHGWGSRLPHYGKPDWMVFDLDPDATVPFARVIAAAREVRDRLAALKLRSFVKTTGGKGLHVVMPLAPRHSWDEVKRFAERFADRMVGDAPRDYVATMSKKQRQGKIFIDWLRNGLGATAVMPYSPRAKPGATVAMPLAWDELDDADPKAYSVATVPGLIEKRRRDPWAQFLATPQALPA